MMWALAFFTLSGVNVTFWTIIGLFRFFSEKKRFITKKMLYNRKIYTSVHSNETNWGGIRTISLGAIIGLLLFILFLYFSGAIYGLFEYSTCCANTTLLGQNNFSDFIFIILLFWLTMACLSGYATVRLRKIYPKRDSFDAGVLFWVMSAFLLFQFFPDFRFQSIYEILLSFVVTIVFALMGGDIGKAINKKLLTKKFNIKPEGSKDCLIENEVAAIVPAHNEELTIENTINALKRILPSKNIYVGSDASTDRTSEIVQHLSCQVLEIFPNRGKAGTLVYLMKYFQLLDRYKAILIVDADSEIDKNYLKRAIPLFNDKKIVAVAGHGVTRWRKHWPPRFSMFFAAYRVRLYRVLQALMRYGQTWKYTNVTSIVPGFASMYRSSVLKEIDINAPGLIIEDYNMTFELHHKKLGKIAYDPKIFAVAQDPYNFKDYANQVKRWNLGFWQTVRRHGFWPSFFWLSVRSFMYEMILYGLFLLIVPAILIWFVLTSFDPIALPFMNVSIDFFDIIIGVFLVDYIMTVIISIIEKKPILLLYGLAFILLRYVDTFMFLFTLPLAYVVKSDGKWVSPERRVAGE